METVYKFGWLPSDDTSPSKYGEVRMYNYPDIFAVEKTTGPNRLTIAPSANHVSILLDLLEAMSEPFGILYLLAVPRGGSNPGRYQAANLVTREQVKQFLTEFKD